MKENRNKILVIAVVAVIIIAGVLGVTALTNNQSNSTKPTNEVEESLNTTTLEVEMGGGKVEYQIKSAEGQTVFDTLKTYSENNPNFTFEYDEYDFGAMITSMNMQEPGENEFWKFLINGEDATVGVSDYVIKSGDTISFELDEIEF